MLRADNVICGTSTTGTGTLTLAATPVPPGGLDFDAWLKATGFNFVSTNAVLVSYTIIEYTSSAFTTAKQSEKGIGTLTLGASITAATLARTTVQSKITSMDSQPATPTYSAPSAISIGTAANVLVFIGASVADTIEYTPYYYDNQSYGTTPVIVGGSTQTVLTATSLHLYTAFTWTTPMLVKRATIITWTGYSGASPVSNAYAAIYAFGTDGRPGKLLIDLGLIGTGGSSLNSNFTAISTALHGSGFFLTPGEYVFDFVAQYTGGSGNPTILFANSVSRSGRLGLSGSNTNAFPMDSVKTDASGTLTPAPDPAYLTGYANSTLPACYFLLRAT